MRSIVLLILTVCVIGLGFGIYWVMLGSDEYATMDVGGKPTTRPIATTLPTPSPNLIGPGDKPYYMRYDLKTGQLTSRLRAERYEPQQDGRWRVIKPEADFFMDGGRVVRIVGETGVITMEETASKGKDELGSQVTARAPRSGTLYGVTLTLLPAIDKAPELTMTMHNTAFNNENALIYTESYSEGHKTIPGDMVPVIVRGEQYEFDGRGLRLQYNELNRRLEKLLITHGHRLLIRHPGQFMRGGDDEQNDPTPALESGAMLRGNGEIAELVMGGVWRPTLPVAGVMLAAADNIAAAEATRGGARARRRTAATAPASVEQPEEQPVYRAVFQQDVEVYRGGRKIASARDLVVDYLTKSSGELSMIGPSVTKGVDAASPAASSRPARQGIRTERRRVPRTQPATPVVAEANSAEANSNAKGPQPDNMDEPIEIRWKGPLTITPMPGDRPDRIAPGESIVKLVGGSGRPVEVTQEGEQASSQIRCASLTYWSTDGGVLLEEAPGIPVEMTDSRGTHISTRMLVFSEKDGTAQLTGKSHAKLPLGHEGAPAEKADPKKEMMDVDWTDRCTLYLQGERLEDMVMSRIDLWGEVNVNHPQMKTRSDTLQLRFAPQSEADKASESAKRSMPPLQQVDASGGVRCVTFGPGGESDIRKVDCDSLKLLTARTEQGVLYARNIVAMGHVHAVDPERELQAGYVHVTLGQPAAKATTQPAEKGREGVPGELESLVAHDNVRVKTTDGKSATANQLTIEVKDGVLSATLHGELAQVTDGKNTLAGPIISLTPGREQLVVTGEGKMTGLVQKTGDTPARPVSVSWTKSLRADGKEDLIECIGSVVAVTTDATGAVTTTKGNRVRIATTRPANAPVRDAVAKTATTRPSEFEMLGEREVRSIALEDQAVVESELKDAAGQLLRLFRVDSASIHYDRDARKLTIPQAGRMLFVDNRAPAAQPTAQEAAKDPFGIRGATAFKWDQSLTYDEAASQVTLLGGVVIARQIKPEEGDDKLQMFGDKVVANLERSPEDANRPANADDLSAKLQFKDVVAEGNIKIISKALYVTAQTIEFDPVKHLLTVRGTERIPAAQWDERGLKMAEFEEMVWNTEKSQVVSRNLKLNRRTSGKDGGGDGTKGFLK